METKYFGQTGDGLTGVGVGGGGVDNLQCSYMWVFTVLLAVSCHAIMKPKKGTCFVSLANRLQSRINLTFNGYE